MAELAAGPHAAGDAEERARLQDRLQRAEAAFDPLPFDGEAARAYGRIYAAELAMGRKARGTRALDLLIAATACLVALTAIARAEPPVAVVEDVQGKVTGAEFMDYVVPGQVIKLGPGGKIVIGYMKSCWRETISGIGTVIVGSEQSAVHLADFKQPLATPEKALADNSTSSAKSGTAPSSADSPPPRGWRRASRG